MTFDEMIKSGSQKPRKKPSEPEHSLQVSCIKWFRMQHKGMMIYAIPNGGHRNTIVATKLKAEGVTAGVPDLHIPVANKFYHGLYIELKVKPNKPSEEQLEMMDKLTNNGYRCAVCYSIDEFMSTVNNYIKDV